MADTVDLFAVSRLALLLPDLASSDRS